MYRENLKTKNIDNTDDMVKFAAACEQPKIDCRGDLYRTLMSSSELASDEIITICTISNHGVSYNSL